LIAADEGTGVPVGLMILFETPCHDDFGGVDLRLGYLLAESAWGRGLGTELVAGFVEWCRATPRIRSIAGGVELHNVGSARVLAKNGFAPAGPPVGGEQLYELALRTNHDR
jgi:RimJ/RimL family protein N-acetyltransferase